MRARKHSDDYQATHSVESADGTVISETEVRFTFDFLPGYPAHTPRGEYGPIDPPEPPSIEITKIEIEDFDKGGNQSWREATPEESERYQAWVDGDDRLYSRMCDQAARG